MRHNPAGDWRLSDIEAICKEFGIDCRPPRGGGSHYKVSHPQMAEKLTMPFKRPIKAIYVRMLVKFVDDVRKLS
jgi:hypothetical protein